jgi:hypothetical protein
MNTDKHGFVPRLAILVVVILVSVWCSSCGSGCSNDVLNEAVSPDGKYVATAFIRSCGATTDFSPQVSLRPIGQKLTGVGNVFVGNHSDKIHVVWQSSTQLVIQTDAASVRLATNFQDIKIVKENSAH